MELILLSALVASGSAYPFSDPYGAGSFDVPNTGYGYQTRSATCEYSEWTQWSPCSAACEQPGFSSRSRVVLYDPGHYACDTSSLEEWRDCFGETCSADCVPGAWSSWSACSSACGPGQRSRSRSIVSNAVGSGASCGNLDETEACDNGPCAQDCRQSSWGPWSPCNSQCGPGERDRSRVTLSPAAYGGAPCGPEEEWEACDNGPCAQDCVQGPWSQWSQCSSACGPGQRSRHRSIISQAVYGGVSCGPCEETEACDNGPCAQDCVQSPWSAWSQCSSACGTGQRSRTRSILTYASNGGFPCGPCEETETCDNGPCAQDCAYGPWQEWSPCPACGQASRTRYRNIIQEGRFGGITCDQSSLSETESCPFVPCSVDCVMGPWSSFSPCSADCGYGQRSRFRSILTQASNGGRPCGETEEWQDCNNGPCAQDCVMGPWSSFGACSAACGSGQRSRSRSVITQAFNGGRPCGETVEYEECNNGPCQQDCVMGQWNPWGPCSVTCGQGTRQRTRSILTNSAFGGRPCGSTIETEQCEGHYGSQPLNTPPQPSYSIFQNPPARTSYSPSTSFASSSYTAPVPEPFQNPTPVSSYSSSSSVNPAPRTTSFQNPTTSYSSSSFTLQSPTRSSYSSSSSSFINNTPKLSTFASPSRPRLTYG